MDRTQLITRLIGPSLDAMGYEVVRVLVMGSHHVKLQVMVEREDRSAMTVDHCSEVSRAVSALLDVEDPIRGPYTLEVSSPGIDRPLTRLGDFDRFQGHVARVETVLPVEGRKRFKGRLLGTEGDRIRLSLDADGEGEVELPFSAVQKAKLVLTDELIAATGGHG